MLLCPRSGSQSGHLSPRNETDLSDDIRQSANCMAHVTAAPHVSRHHIRCRPAIPSGGTDQGSAAAGVLHEQSKPARPANLSYLSPRHETDPSDEIRPSAINSDLVLAAPD